MCLINRFWSIDKSAILDVFGINWPQFQEMVIFLNSWVPSLLSIHWIEGLWKIWEQYNKQKKAVTDRRPDRPNFIGPYANPGIEIDWRHRLKLFPFSLKNGKLEPNTTRYFSFQLVWVFFRLIVWRYWIKGICAKNATPEVSKYGQ